MEKSNSSDVSKNIEARLNGVPETMLWTLYNRANEAMRPDGIIQDPWCVQIYKSINYNYQKIFGKPDSSHAVRSITFDREIKKFLQKYPNGLIIALGEGLETQALRCDNGRNRWLSIDLPEAIEIREKCFESNPRHSFLKKSALDYTWMDQIQDEPVFIVVQGLLMYFKTEEVCDLLTVMDQRFNSYALIFDTIPKWFSNLTIKGFKKTDFYTTPPMPWGIDVNEVPIVMNSWLPSLKKIKILRYKFPRGVFKYLGFIFEKVPIVKNKTPSIVLCQKNLEF